jgi:hypothetical protein
MKAFPSNTGTGTKPLSYPPPPSHVPYDLLLLSDDLLLLPYLIISYSNLMTLFSLLMTFSSN